MKFSVLFSFLVVLVFAVLFQGGEQVQAGGGGTVVNNSDIFHWRVQWSQPISGTNDRRTDWFLNSFFTETVLLQFDPVTSTAPIVPMETALGPEGVSGTILGGLQEFTFPWLMQFRVKGLPTYVAESNWRRENCSFGPEFFAEIHEYPNSNDSRVRLLVHNTTGQRLYLQVGGGVFPIVPGDSRSVEKRVTVESPGDTVFLFLDALGAPKECARFSWNFPPMQNLDLTPVPTITYPLTVPLTSGWNLVAAPSTGSKAADDLLSEIDGTGVRPKQVARWQNGMWESHLWGFTPNNFPIELGRGYFVRVEQGGVWTPGRHISSAVKRN